MIQSSENENGELMKIGEVEEDKNFLHKKWIEINSIYFVKYTVSCTWKTYLL